MNVRASFYNCICCHASPIIFHRKNLYEMSAEVVSSRNLIGCYGVLKAELQRRRGWWEYVSKALDEPYKALSLFYFMFLQNNNLSNPSYNQPRNVFPPIAIVNKNIVYLLGRSNLACHYRSYFRSFLSLFISIYILNVIIQKCCLSLCFDFLCVYVCLCLCLSVYVSAFVCICVCPCVCGCL